MSGQASDRRVGSGQGAAVESSYRGAVARDYLARRADSLKWRLEDRVVESLLGSLPRGETILDAPAGTGRFVAAYAKHGQRFVGIDVSLDMLAQARAEQRSCPAPGGLVQGIVGELPLADGSVDHVLSTRLLNWFDRDGLRQALEEFKRVSRQLLVLEIRLSRPLGWRQLPGLAGELLRHPVTSLRRLGRSLLPPPTDRPALRLHSDREFGDLIENLGLIIRRRLPIADGTACTRRLFRHTPLAFFVLARRDGERPAGG